MSRINRALLAVVGVLLNSFGVLRMANLHPELQTHWAMVSILEFIMFAGGGLFGYAIRAAQPVGTAKPESEKEGEL